MILIFLFSVVIVDDISNKHQRWRRWQMKIFYWNISARSSYSITIDDRRLNELSQLPQEKGSLWQEWRRMKIFWVDPIKSMENKHSMLVRQSSWWQLWLIGFIKEISVEWELIDKMQLEFVCLQKLEVSDSILITLRKTTSIIKIFNLANLFNFSTYMWNELNTITKTTTNLFQFNQFRCFLVNFNFHWTSPHRRSCDVESSHAVGACILCALKSIIDIACSQQLSSSQSRAHTWPTGDDWMKIIKKMLWEVD